MKKLIFATLFAACACVAPTANAVSIDATFSAGASLSDFGFTGGGNVAPSGNVAGGVWTNNRSASEVSYWTRATTATELAGPVVHGFAEITATSFAGASGDDQTVLLAESATGASPFAFSLLLIDGAIRVQTTPGFQPNITVANSDDLKHTYGWELDLTAKTLQVFFDNAAVGSLIDVTRSGGGVNGGDSFYLGDGTGGAAHNDVWDRVVVAEGAYPVVPEPSSVALLAIGVVAMLPRLIRRVEDLK